MIRVLIFDKGHNLLDETTPSVGAVSWRLNNIGRAAITMSYDDPKCTRTNLAPGNRVLIEFDTGLPHWVGVIDTPRIQSQFAVSVTAYSAEHLFTHRVTEKYIEIISGGSGGAFKMLVSRSNSIRSLGVDVGNIYYGGVQRKYVYHYSDLWKEIQALAELSGHDFDVTGTYDDGRLILLANWYDLKGSDKTQTVALSDWANIQTSSLNQQGNIANQVFMVGTGQTWGDERLVETARDATSESDYGYREYVEIQSRVSDSATLLENANQKLADIKEPASRFRITAENADPGKFGTYEPGDRIRLNTFLDRGEWAYNGTVRVKAMEHSANEMRVEVEEWLV